MSSCRINRYVFLLSVIVKILIICRIVPAARSAGISRADQLSRDIRCEVVEVHNPLRFPTVFWNWDGNPPTSGIRNTSRNIFSMLQSYKDVIFLPVTKVSFCPQDGQRRREVSLFVMAVFFFKKKPRRQNRPERITQIR